MGDAERLDGSRVRAHLAPVLETIERVAAALPDATALIGFAGAPWTLAAYAVEGGGSREFAVARAAARRQPDFFAALVERLTQATIDYLCAQIEAGAEAVQLFDSWAGVLAPEERERWCVAPTRRIVTALKEAHPQVPVILFPRGVGPAYARFAVVGADALGLDTTVEMAWAARHLSPDLALQGNLDPTALLGPVDALLGEADRIVAAAQGRAHIFNLGHGVLPETSPEHVKALVDHLKSRQD
jgi:uroporphyrinogen decarboxylase